MVVLYKVSISEVSIWKGPIIDDISSDGSFKYDDVQYHGSEEESNADDAGCNAGSLTESISLTFGSLQSV